MPRPENTTAPRLTAAGKRLLICLFAAEGARKHPNFRFSIGAASAHEKLIRDGLVESCWGPLTAAGLAARAIAVEARRALDLKLARAKVAGLAAMGITAESPGFRGSDMRKALRVIAGAEAA